MFDLQVLFEYQHTLIVGHCHIWHQFGYLTLGLEPPLMYILVLKIWYKRQTFCTKAHMQRPTVTFLSEIKK